MYSLRKPAHTAGCGSLANLLASGCDAVFVHPVPQAIKCRGQRNPRAGVRSLQINRWRRYPRIERSGAGAKVPDATRLALIAVSRRCRELKTRLGTGHATGCMEPKHRVDSVGSNDFTFTLLDDHSHVVDTCGWRAARRVSAQMLLNSEARASSCSA